MLPDEDVFVGTVVSIISIRDDPWIVVFVGSLISWSSPYITHVAECFAFRSVVLASYVSCTILSYFSYLPGA